MEDTIIRQKLVTDEKLVRRIAKRALNLTKSDVSNEEYNLDHRQVPELLYRLEQQRILIETEIKLFDLSIDKQERSVSVHEKEKLYYSERQQNIEQEIKVLTLLIEDLKETLEKEQQLRKNKDEYDQISKEILKFSSKVELSRQLDQVKDETDQILEQLNEIQRCLESKAISAFENMNSLKEIRHNVDNDIKTIGSSNK